MEKYCKFCKKTLIVKNHQAFGAHITNCYMNPINKTTIEKRKDTRKAQWKLIDVNCSKCGKEFKVNEYSKAKFKKNIHYCSRHCANKRIWTAEDNLKKSISAKNSEIIKNKIKLKNKCKICDNLVKKHENIYCSIKCVNSCPDHKKLLSNIKKEFYLYNPEKHPNRLCAGVKESYPETFFKDFLLKNGLVEGKDFIQQYKIRRYYIDFFFPSIKTCVEIDGERFHNKNSEREIIREKIIILRFYLKRFEVKPLLKKEYESEIIEIINKVKNSSNTFTDDRK